MLKATEIFNDSCRYSYKDWLNLYQKGRAQEDKLYEAKLKSIEGITKSILGTSDTQYELYTFPKVQKKCSLFDLQNFSEDFLRLDEELGIDKFYLNTSESFNNSISRTPIDKFRPEATFIINSNDSNIIESYKEHSVLVDVNTLLFKDFFNESKHLKRLLADKTGKFLIDLSHVHNAGGSVVQELTYGIYLFKSLVENEFSPVDIVFKVACGSELFLNIAKLKSLRFIVEALCENVNTSPTCHIIGSPSLREQTLYDPWNNILRNTTSSMAQLMGGADDITSKPYDFLFSKLTFDKSTLLAHRYAQQSLNVLIEEAKLGYVIDPLKGSGTVGNLVEEMIQSSWESLLNWDKRNFLKSGKDFALEVAAIAKTRVREAHFREKTIVGVNNYANRDQTIYSLYGKSWRPVELKAGHFPLRRSVSQLEDLRMQYEFSEKKLSIALLVGLKKDKLQKKLSFIKNLFDIIGIHYTDYDIDTLIGNSATKKLNKFDCLCFCLCNDEVDSIAHFLERPKSKELPVLFVGKLESKIGEYKHLKEVNEKLDVFAFLKELLIETKVL